MADWITVYDIKAWEKPDQPTGVLTQDGKPIVKINKPVGFHVSHETIYTVKNK